jgi:hypothetical protein
MSLVKVPYLKQTLRQVVLVLRDFAAAYFNEIMIAASGRMEVSDTEVAECEDRQYGSLLLPLLCLLQCFQYIDSL